MERFRGALAENLIRYVYDRYPWFTINSSIDARSSRPVAAPAVHTAGYEGHHVDGFLNGMLLAGIQLLVDVRNNPVSRRYGFHRSTLMRLCANVGIEYRHFPELGIEAQHRRHLETAADRTRLFDWYEGTTLRRQSASIHRVAELLAAVPGVLMCMEADHHCCHRSRLARAVQESCGLSIKHLEPG